MVQDEEKGDAGLTISTGTTLDHNDSVPNTPSTQQTQRSSSSRDALLRPVASLTRFCRSLTRLLSPTRRVAAFCAAAPETTVREIHNTAQGYPKLAAFLDSDDNFMLYRRFGYLQSRLLLEHQDELRLLEEELDRMDRKDVKKDRTILMTRRDYDEAHFESRKELLAKIRTKFCEYSEIISSAQALTSSNKPTSAEFRSVKNWITNVGPVYDADASFIDHKGDLLTLRPGREHAWLDASVERLLRHCNCKFIEYLFRSKDTRRKTDGNHGEVYYTRERIERLVVGIIVLMILVLLVVPIYILYHLTNIHDVRHSNAVCIGVLIVFTLAFSACISLFTRAKRHEILAASAGYCAVLVVFIGNIGGIGNFGGLASGS